MIIGGVVGVVVVLVVVLIIVLSGGKSDDSGGDKPGPTPGPTPGPIPSGYNLYKVDMATVEVQNSVVTGTLDGKDPSTVKFEPLRSSNGGLQVDPSTIPLGANNQKPSKLAFEFGQAEYYTSYLSLTDENNTRFSIPEMLVNKPKNQWDKRLDMSGFKMFSDPFGF